MLVLKLAFRNLFRNTRRTVLTMMLIAFSLTSLILVDAIIIGMIQVMEQLVTQTLAGEAQVQRKGFTESFESKLLLEDTSEIESQLEEDPVVLAYSPRVISGGMVSSSYNISGGMVYGVDYDKERRVGKLDDAIKEGSYLTGDPGEILIGTSMAELLEVELGDRLVLTLSEARSGELSQALFRVSGIFEFGIREFDDGFAFINIDAARKALALDDESHQIAIRFVDPADAKNPDLPLFSRLTSDDVEAIGWMDANPEIASMIYMSDYSSLITGLILFLLASLGVINSMFMSIYERIYEIGVVKAIGTTPRELLLLVMAEAGLIAVISAILGALLGLALGTWFGIHGIPIGEFEMSGLDLSDPIKTILAPRQFIDFPIYVVLLTLAAALYPARFASRIVPADALQRSL
jgi:ABC-type lipoprotein release transport system permease subunit